jgi:hypothetical protein
MFGCLSQIAVVGTAIAAGLDKLSFWWVLIPVFLAASLQLSNGPGFDTIIRANQEGRLGYFPTVLGVQCVVWLAVAGAIYWVTGAVR